MDKQWIEHQKDKRLFIKKIENYLLSSPNISYIIPYVEKLFDIYNVNQGIEYGPYLIIDHKEIINITSHLLNNYIEIFRIKDEDKIEFLEYVLYAGKILSRYNITDKKYIFNPIWSKYTSGLLPLQARMIINKTMPFDLISIMIFYAKVGIYSKQKGGSLEALGYSSYDITPKLIKNFIKRRIASDISFILMDLNNIDYKKVQEYLEFEKDIALQLDNNTFSSFSSEKEAEIKKIISQVSPSLSLPHYANLEEEIFKTQVYRWLISLGLKNDSEYKSVLELMDKIYPEVKKFYNPPELKDLLDNIYQVKVRYLHKLEASELLEEEFKRQRTNLFRGTLIFWTDFVWKNNLSIQDMNMFFSFLNYIRGLQDFKDIFGDRYLFSGANFYMSTLSYWAQWAIDKYKKNINSYSGILEDLKEKFQLMKYIYSLDSYHIVYGNINLSHLNPIEKYGIKSLETYISILSFFVDWMQLNNLSKDYVSKYFENLNLMMNQPFSDRLKEFYYLIDINIDLNTRKKADKIKRHILGIYSSWVNYLLLRNYENKAQINDVLDEILYIAKLSKQNKLGLNQDQIKYWFNRKYEKGYTNQDIKTIFVNMQSASNLLANSASLAINNIKSEKLKFINSIKLKRKLISNIKDIGKTYMFSGEKQRLAEEIILPQKINIKDLIQDYSEGIIIDASNIIYTGNRLLPQQIHKYSSIFRTYGFSIPEMINFINLKTIIKNEEENLIKKLTQGENLYPRLSDQEINGFLAHIFSEWEAPYAKKILKSFKLLYPLQNSFYKEHGYYLDPKRALNLVTSRDSVYKIWQIKLLVKRGALSSESKDLMIKNLGPDLNLKRTLMNNLLEVYVPIESSHQIEFFKNIFYAPYWYSKRDSILNTVQQLNIFHDNLTYNLMTYDKNTLSADKELDSIFLASKDITFSLADSIWNYIKTEQKKENLKRRNEILLLQKQQKNNVIKMPNLPKSRKPLLEDYGLLDEYTKKLYKLAKENYNTTLTPNQVSSLLWRIREGFSINEALKIYVGDKKKIQDIYKEAFQESQLSSVDSNIITYLAEQINFFPLSIEQLEEILSIAHIIEKQSSRLLNANLSKNKILIAAHKAYYSGATQKHIKEIFTLIKKITKGLSSSGLYSQSELKNSIDKLIKSDYFKYRLSNTLSLIFEIELFSDIFEKLYEDSLYNSMISKLLENMKLPHYFKSQKSIQYLRENLKSTNQTPFNFRYMIFKTKKLSNLLLDNKYQIDLYKLLIYSDMNLQSFSNRLYVLNLIPSTEIKNLNYYWNQLNRKINNYISKTREKNITDRLRHELKDLKYSDIVGEKADKLNSKVAVERTATTLLSIILYLAIASLVIVLIVKTLF